MVPERYQYHFVGVIVASEAINDIGSAGARTQDPRLKRPLLDPHENAPKPKQANSLDDRAEPTPESSAALSRAIEGSDARLATIIEAWPTLSEPIRRAVTALIRAAEDE